MAWRHPAGMRIPADPGRDGDYQPPIVLGVPFRADGQPGLLCAGWAGRDVIASTRSNDPRIDPDVAAIIDAVADRAIPFLARRIAGDPAGEIRKTRRLIQADLDSEPVRRAGCRYWVAQRYVRLRIAHQLYPQRFAHPGPFDTPERLVQVEDTYARHYARGPLTFAARMASDRSWR